jgi:Uncharacterized conserved protein
VRRARDLVLRYGWNATAFQIVNPGMRHWFSAAGDAVIGYVRRAGVRVVAGAPVCDGERLEAVLREWEGEAARAGERVCYFGAAGRVHEVLGATPGHATVVLGAQPVWDPADWAGIVDARASLRAQLARARNKGVRVSEWPPERAERSGALRACLREWLETRGLPPLHFLVEPETLSDLSGRRIFVAERGATGEVVGFAVLSPVPRRNGWLTEQFPRARVAPNGTVELLLDAAVRAVAADGAEYVTMGLVPLAAHNWNPRDYNPLWLCAVMAWVRAHGRRFYDFAGLDAFKSKFRPQGWEPIFAISNEARFSPRTLWAITEAFGGRSPVSLVATGLWRAAVQELRWLRGGAQ